MSQKQLILPKFRYKDKFEGTKNEIVHQCFNDLVLENIDLKFEVNSVTIKTKDENILVVEDKNFKSLTHSKLLYTKDVSILKKESDLRTISYWIKHPKIKNYSPKEIINSWENSITIVEENNDKNIEGLREPQAGAIYNTLGHWISSDELGTIVLPTGTGKTETMLTLLAKIQSEKLLVVVPSDALRNQISEKFISFGLLKRLKVLSQNSKYPKVGILKEKFKTKKQLKKFIESCNVVVSTINLLSGSTAIQQDFIAESFSHLFIDEAHHVMAKTWFSFRNKFKPIKVVQFTATPYRNDSIRLDGKIIFNFPLRKAQEQGYFKKINFIPVKKFDKNEADVEIAKTAVAKLRDDLANGYDHRLLARCDSQKRANKIFEIYKKETDLNPVCIHTGVSKRAEKERKLLSGKAKIVVCVDMFGEGFDLPELKIAAFHDVRKSLPVTIQFAGRFTRSSRDKNLGDATIIANIKDVEFNNELEKLYGHDPDWNLLLPLLSSNQIDSESEFKDFMAGFKNIDKSKVPIQNLRPSLSTVVYSTTSKDGWSPTNFEKGIAAKENFDYVFHDINWDKKVLIVITGKKKDIDWGVSKEIYDVNWELLIVFWEVRNNLLFIHGSNKSGHYEDLAKAVFGDEAAIVNKIDIYRAFHNVKRVKLQNIGLKEYLGKNIRFRMSAGTDIEQALSMVESQRAQKAFAFGIGYENGNKISLGCSSKGRIWTRMKGNIKGFTEWSKKLSKKLGDSKIDPNTILRNTLIPSLVAKRPSVYPICIDWDEDMYLYPETKYNFIINGTNYDLSSCHLEITNSSSKSNLTFGLVTDDITVEFELKLFKDKDGFPDFEIIALSKLDCFVEYGRKKVLASDFFTTKTPSIWFADGSSLTGNEFVELKQVMKVYPKSAIISDWDWTGIDLSKEAQGVKPKKKNSIQYRAIEILKKEDYDIIYDDDGSGEIADIVTVKLENDELKIKFFHLKFANKGKVSAQIKNLYEVCGQAQKSIHWKHKKGKEFFAHLQRRITKKWKGKECSRLEKGTIQDLEKYEDLAKRQIPMKFEVYIVQPSISPKSISDDMLSLLSVTENYLKEKAGIKLNVIGNL